MSDILQRLRGIVSQGHMVLRGDLWFPHIPLALLVMHAGVMMLRIDLYANWHAFFQTVRTGELLIAPQLLPLLLIGGGMVLFGAILALRSRIAWIMTLLLLIAAVASTILGRPHIQVELLIYFLLCITGLLAAWEFFGRSSLAAGTLFSSSAVVMALFYATFGSFYFGTQFKPPITDLGTALYFAMVSMTTVGYGDIIPATPQARWFAVSVIMVGVAVFVTSFTAVIAPIVSGSINRLIRPKDIKMERSGHYVVIGNTRLAINTSRELIRRGRPVTRIVREDVNNLAGRGVDTIVGDGSSLDILREAGADKAESVLAMKSDDSENAFIVLAVRELSRQTERHVRTVIAVNDARHMDRIRLVQPDLVIAPEVLGGELIAMMLSGETISPDFLMDRIFQKIDIPPLQ